MSILSSFRRHLTKNWQVLQNDQFYVLLVLISFSVHDLELKGTPISVGKIDISQSREDHPILVKRYQIHHLPTLRLFVAGGVVKYQGPLQVKPITGWLTKVCSNPEKYTRK